MSHPRSRHVLRSRNMQHQQIKRAIIGHRISGVSNNTVTISASHCHLIAATAARRCASSSAVALSWHPDASIWQHCMHTIRASTLLHRDRVAMTPVWHIRASSCARGDPRVCIARVCVCSTWLGKDRLGQQLLRESLLPAVHWRGGWRRHRLALAEL